MLPYQTNDGLIMKMQKINIYSHYVIYIYIYRGYWLPLKITYEHKKII